MCDKVNIINNTLPTMVQYSINFMRLLSELLPMLNFFEVITIIRTQHIKNFVNATHRIFKETDGNSTKSNTKDGQTACLPDISPSYVL